MSAYPEHRGKRHVGFHSGNIGYLGTESGNPLGSADGAFGSRQQLHKEASRISGAAAAAERPAYTRLEGLYCRIFGYDVAQPLGERHHLFERGALRRLRVHIHLVIVLIRNESFGNDDVQITGNPQNDKERGSHHWSVAKDPAQSNIV